MASAVPAGPAACLPRRTALGGSTTLRASSSVGPGRGARVLVPPTSVYKCVRVTKMELSCGEEASQRVRVREHARERGGRGKEGGRKQLLAASQGRFFQQVFYFSHSHARARGTEGAGKQDKGKEGTRGGHFGRYLFFFTFLFFFPFLLLFLFDSLRSQKQ